LSIRSAGAWPAGRPDLCSSCCRSLRVVPALLLALQALRWAALRHLAISCLFLLFPPMARASPGWLPVPVVRVHYDCPSVFPACVLVRRCQARSCLLQNLAPTDAVLCLLHLFWIRLAWPVRWTNTRVLRNTFNLHPPISGGPMGGQSRSLARCRCFHPSIRARDTCRKTRAEVYKAFRFPQGRLSQASVQYFRSCKLLSLGTWSSCSLSSGSYELVD
jgi:hypothetical protein